jgi:hypothetical protein
MNSAPLFLIADKACVEGRTDPHKAAAFSPVQKQLYIIFAQNSTISLPI